MLHTCACFQKMLAQAEVQNLLALLRMYGFVPNGARSYYTNRRHVNGGRHSCCQDIFLYTLHCSVCVSGAALLHIYCIASNSSKKDELFERDSLPFE